MKTSVSSYGRAEGDGTLLPGGPCGRLLFLSGQMPLDPATGHVVEGDIAAQTRRVLDNIGAVLKAGGSVVRRRRPHDGVSRGHERLRGHERGVRRRTFSEPLPGRATVQVARLPRDARIEIDAIAMYEAGGLLPIRPSRPSGPLDSQHPVHARSDLITFSRCFEVADFDGHVDARARSSSVRASMFLMLVLMSAIWR